MARKTSKWVAQSRTLAFNVLMTVFATVEANQGLLKPLFHEDVYAVMLFVCIAGNSVLRMVTTTGLSLKR